MTATPEEELVDAVLPGVATEDIRAGEVCELAVDARTGAGRVRRQRAGGDPIPRWFEKPEQGVRLVPRVDDDAIVNAVLAARAVVRLDEQRWKLTIERAELLGLVDKLKAEIGRLNEANRTLTLTVAGVRMLHRQATRNTPDCGDGCCVETELLGVCEHDGEPHPCTTLRAVGGE